MKNTPIKAQKREPGSRGAIRKMRREGRIPGVVYGKGVKEATPISVESKDLESLMKSHAHGVLELELPGMGKKNVLLSEVQRDSLSREILHVDFHKINMNETIKAPVRIEVSGKSPGEKEGGMLQIVLHELEVECLPKNLPESIVAEVDRLQVGDNLTIGDLKLPDNVKATLDPETVVVAILAPQKENAEDEDDAAVDAAGENEKQAETVKAGD